MGTTRTAVEFVEPDAFDASSEQADFPKEDAVLIDKPFQPWRSSAEVANAWVGFDFGTDGINLATDWVIVGRTNVQLIRIEVANDASYTTDLLTSSAIAVAVDTRDSRRKVSYELANLAASGTRRYLRVRADALAVADDGESSFLLGSFALTHSATTWADPFTLPRTTEKIRPALSTGERLAGGRRTVGVGNIYARFRINAVWPLSMRAAWEVLADVGEERVFWWEPDDAAPHETYFVKMVGAPELSWTNANRLAVSGAVFEETV